MLFFIPFWSLFFLRRGIEIQGDKIAIACARKGTRTLVGCIVKTSTST